MYVPDAIQMPVGALLHHRREMHRIDQLRLRVRPGKLCERGHDVLHRLSVILAPVTGHKDDLPARVVQLVELFCRKAIVLAYRCFQSVNDRVAGNEHALGHALARKVRAVILRGAEIKVGEPRDELTVHLLGIGRILIVGAQPRLDMADLHLVVKGRERAGKGRGGIAVDKDHIGRKAVDDLVHTGQALTGDGRERLTRGHNVEVGVRLEAKDLHDAVEHLAMLRRHAAKALDALAPRELLDERSHLDRLRPRAEDAHHFNFLHAFLPSPPAQARQTLPAFPPAPVPFRGRSPRSRAGK